MGYGELLIGGWHQLKRVGVGGLEPSVPFRFANAWNFRKDDIQVAFQIKTAAGASNVRLPDGF